MGSEKIREKYKNKSDDKRKDNLSGETAINRHKKLEINQVKIETEQWLEELKETYEVVTINSFSIKNNKLIYSWNYEDTESIIDEFNEIPDNSVYKIDAIFFFNKLFADEKLDDETKLFYFSDILLKASEYWGIGDVYSDEELQYYGSVDNDNTLFQPFIDVVVKFEKNRKDWILFLWDK